MSPYIFVLIIQKFLTEVQRKFPSLKLLELGRQGLPVALAFADDILLISKSVKDIEKIVRLLKVEFSKFGLELNPKKSNIMIREPLRSRSVPEQVIIDGDEIEIVKTLRYLGTFLTSTLDRPNATRIRCKQAVKSARIVIEFVRKFKPSWDIVKLIYMTVISPAITYGLKGAALVKRNRKSIARYEMQIIKELLRYCRNRPRGRIRVSRLLNGKTAVNRIRVMQFKFWAHIRRRESGHPLRMAENLKFKERKRGRPAKTWNENIKETKRKWPNLNERFWENLAKDKNKFNKKAEEIYEMQGSEEESCSELED